MTGQGVALDRSALVQAVATGVLVVGPLAGLSILLVDPDAGDTGGPAGVLFVGILLGLGLAGWMAGRQAADAPAVHGTLAGTGTYVVVQTTILAMASVAGRDTDVSILGIVVGALFAASAGAIGAMLGSRRARRPGGGLGEVS